MDLVQGIEGYLMRTIVSYDERAIELDPEIIVGPQYGPGNFILGVLVNLAMHRISPEDVLVNMLVKPGYFTITDQSTGSYELVALKQEVYRIKTSGLVPNPNSPNAYRDISVYEGVFSESGIITFNLVNMEEFPSNPDIERLVNWSVGLWAWSHVNGVPDRYSPVPVDYSGTLKEDVLDKLAN